MLVVWDLLPLFVCWSYYVLEVGSPSHVMDHARMVVVQVVSLSNKAAVRKLVGLCGSRKFGISVQAWISCWLGWMLLNKCISIPVAMLEVSMLCYG